MHANGAAQYFEALKIRNLLQEFEAPEEGAAAGRRTGRQARPRPITIVGFPSTCKPCLALPPAAALRARLSACNWRGAAAVLGICHGDLHGDARAVFWHLLQRVLAAPLDVRFYGHPDLLDKLHFLTRGGISASKEINLSEDVFAGYKRRCTAAASCFASTTSSERSDDKSVGDLRVFWQARAGRHAR